MEPGNRLEPQRTVGQRLTTLGRTVVGWAVIAIAVILVLRLAAGVIIGLVQTVLLLVALVAIAFAVLWALGQVRRR